MPLSKIRFNPGIDKEGTEYTAGAGWYDGDKVRFRKGRPEKIGGWRKFSQSSFLGVCRSLFDWASLEFLRFIGVGTNLKFYVTEGTNYSDITPIRDTTAAGDVTFAATDGSSTITVSDTSHGAVLNDFVTFSGAVSLGGNITADVLNQEYEITGVPTANTYTITAKDTSGVTVTANASDTGNGGASVVGEYQINTGLNAYVAGSGWGAGAWGASTWGSASPLSAAGQLRLYSQDSFGEDLIFNVRAGGIYYWDESSGASTRAVALEDLAGASNAPTVALQIMVSDTDRHVIAFGCNPIGSSAIDPLFVRFSDQENAVDWTPTATNTAGGVRINSGSIIVGALQTRQEILIWTDASLHSMRFVGSPFVFQFDRITSDASMISPNAAVDVGGVVYFMDRGNFFLYNGSVQTVPCTVKDYVFSNLNQGQAYKVFAAENRRFSEVTWFYPVGQDNTEITNYVTYNYAEGVWSIGTLGRGAWISSGTRDFPIASSVIDGGDNYLYEHEVGFDDDGQPMTSYIESGGIELADGEQFAFMKRIIPDFEFSGSEASASVDVVIKGADFPLQDKSTLSTSAVTPSSTQLYVRNRSREVVVRLESDGSGYGWRSGDLRFDLRTDGKR
jgi:hypothetical protein